MRAAGLLQVNRMSHVPTTEPSCHPIQGKLINDGHEQVHNWKLLRLYFFISTPEFINDETHQHYSYLNFLVNLGIVGLHGDPNILNKALHQDQQLRQRQLKMRQKGHSPLLFYPCPPASIRE